MPLPGRWLTSCLIRYNGTTVLIDCGEGTQVTMRETGWSFKAIDYILFTHYHGDHISGLPGLLLTIGNCERTEPLTLIGPRGLRKIVEGLLLIAPGLPFPIHYIELTREQIQDQQEMQLGELFVRPCQADHGIPCVGYSVEVKRQPKFDPMRAKEAGIPLPYWRRLQNGETVTEEDVDAIVKKSLKSRVFEMLDAMIEGKANLVFPMLEEMKLCREVPIKILVLIGRQACMLGKTRVLLDSGANDIAMQLGLKPFIAQKYIAQARRLTADRAKNLIDKCLAADYSIKTGESTDWAALEMLVADITSGRY